MFFNKKSLEKKKTIALLGALCLFLSAIEYMIPKPFPFMRTGITNLPIMLALDILPFFSFVVLLAIKVTGQALVTGTLFSWVFLFSAAGAAVSGTFMFGLRKIFGKEKISFIGLGTAGALLSNVTQLFLAWIFIFGENTRYISPLFLAAGLVSGLLLGFFCEYFTKHSSWYKNEIL